MTNLLFVCTANLQRSKTGEDIFSDKYNTRSAGVLCSDTQLTTAINKDLLEWADVVFVFEKDHVLYLKENFPHLDKKVVNLQVPDMYPYKDKELIKILKERVPVVMQKINELSTGYHNFSDLVEE